MDHTVPFHYLQSQFFCETDAYGIGLCRFFCFSYSLLSPCKKGGHLQDRQLELYSETLSQLALSDADLIRIKVDLRHVFSQKLSVHSCEVFRKQF